MGSMLKTLLGGCYGLGTRRAQDAACTSATSSTNFAGAPATVGFSSPDVDILEQIALRCDRRGLGALACVNKAAHAATQRPAVYRKFYAGTRPTAPLRALKVRCGRQQRPASP